MTDKEKMEEAAKTYAKKESHGYEPCNIVKTFKAGAQWQKEQMMKGAVEGRLGSTVTGSEQYVSAYVGYGEYGKDGDEVKVIIIKE